jgi:hypothetical protein
MKWIITLAFLFSFSSFGSCNPAPATVAGEIPYVDLTENSGMDFSRRHANLIWSLNDAHHAPRIFAFQSNGVGMGEFLVQGAENSDWEDISVSSCYYNPAIDCIYAADIGNNKRKRETFSIYVIEEPQAFLGQMLKPTQIFTFKAKNKNFESLVYNEKTKEFYLFSKVKRTNPDPTPSMYKISPGQSEMTKVVDLNFNQMPGLTAEDAMITSADLDTATDTLFIGTYGKAYEIALSNVANFVRDAHIINMPAMKQAESISYYNKAIFTSSEGVKQPIFQIKCL